MDIKAEKNVQSLIDDLASELGEPKVMRHPLYSCVPWAVVGIVYIVFAFSVLGVRHNIFEKIADPNFVFEISLTLSLSISAAFSAIWLRYPDIRGQSWILSIPLTLFAVFTVLISLRTFMEAPSLPDIHVAHRCYKHALIFGVIPAISIWVLSMRGKTTHPVLLSLMNALAVGGLGYIGLRITCHADDVRHLCIYHILPYLLLGFIAAVCGRRIYRW
ncbi:MAG: NrsF family protein [Alphaproteobacteria bacterium]